MNTETTNQLNNKNQWSFFIEGVRCSKCIQKLESLDNDNNHLSNPRFNKGQSLLTLEADSQITPEETIKIIEDKGYRAYIIHRKSELEEKKRYENRSWLTRLAVTFFFATNLMIFSASLYTGATGQWRFLFSYLSGILYLPVLLYSAIPFYQNAYQSIKAKQFSADLAVAIAFLWGSFFSYINLFRGNDSFYFDSSASFLFLILLARYTLYRAQQSIETELNPSLLFKKNPFYLLLKSNTTNPIKVQFDQIKPMDQIKVLQNQLIPVDGILIKTKAEIDTSLFSGESLPQIIEPGQELKAGMVLLSEEIEMQANNNFENSELNHLLEGVLSHRQVKTKAHTQAEVYSQYLLKTVATLSVLLLLYFGFIASNWSEGFTRSLALFTIACPCALALAIPLASITTLKRALSHGIIAKTPLLFEKLNDIDSVVFDKTGTLTEGHLHFESYYPPNPDTVTLQILLSLEEPSKHPLAKTLSQKLRTEGISKLPITDWQETIGSGVSCKYNTDTYEIRRLNATDQHAPYSTGFCLFKNNQQVLSVYFKDKLRIESKEIIDYLKSKNLKIYIYSGDRNTVVEHIANQLGIDQKNHFAQMSPQEKTIEVKKTKALMVGDGHNDSLGLSAAHVSMAISGSAETSLQAADCYSQHSGLNGIPILFDLSKFYFSIIRQNLILSLSYNFIAGTLAIFGYINPLAAALLMPLNSLIVISFTALAQPKISDSNHYTNETKLKNLTPKET